MQENRFKCLVLISAISLGIAWGTASLVGAQVLSKDSVVVNSGEKFEAINDVMQEMFWRARANDNTVFYENEFPYLRVEMSADKYLTGVRFLQRRKPNSDSLTATQLDSVLIVEDTAIAFLTTFAGSVEDTTPRRKYSTPQKLYFYNGRWIHPLSTTHKNQQEYMERIRNYEEAVERDKHKLDGN